MVDSRLSILFATLLLAAGFGVACGNTSEPSTGDWTVEEGDGDQTGYDENATVVVDTDGDTDDVIIKGDGSGCVDAAGGCIDPVKARNNADDPHCEDPDARADVVVEDGEVVDVICYPPKEDGTNIEEVGEESGGTTEVPQTENGSIVTFDPSTDGEPIEGDVTISSERTTLYGNGVDKTTIEGNVTVASNESRVRSLTVDGNVTYQKNSNNSALAFCRILGNLEVSSNDFTATDCRVFGDVTVDGKGARMLNIGVAGDWEIDPSADCRGCYSFTDQNEDQVVQPAEHGEELKCNGGGGGNNNRGGP